MKNICILGSTGSIGVQALDIIRLHGGFRVISLAAHSRIDILEKQIQEFKPQKVCVFDAAKAAELRQRLGDSDTIVLAGMDGLLEIAGDESNEMTLCALVGMIGIRPTIAAINAGSDIALANKETLVCAGHIIMPLLAEKKVRLTPVDSEHSAIFQALQCKDGMDGYYRSGENYACPSLEKILLTASGGPFRGKSYEELKNFTKYDALKHPNWSMGQKITIDSATMVNKALEVIEAKWLFGVAAEDIEILIQPKSIIHSAVQFKDGAVIAQLGVPDMKLPIQYALYYPERKDLDWGEEDSFAGSSRSGRLDFKTMRSIELDVPDYEVFKGLAMGLLAAKTGGSLPTVFNAANEYAVARFLKDEITLTGIYDIIDYAMSKHTNIENPTVEQILEAEQEAYRSAEEYLGIKS